jgi:hypothetical protein
MLQTTRFYSKTPAGLHPEPIIKIMALQSYGAHFPYCLNKEDKEDQMCRQTSFHTWVASASDQTI